jgi:hypothetical protein
MAFLLIQILNTCILRNENDLELYMIDMMVLNNIKEKLLSNNHNVYSFPYDE